MTTELTKRRWKIPGPVREFIDNCMAEPPNWNATDIYAAMQDELKDRKDLPTLRTVQSYVRANRPSDLSGVWVPTDWPGEDAATVLDSLVCEMHMLQAEIPWPTIREAELILWVRKAAPSLPAERAPNLARYYLIYEARKESTARLDWTLAHGLWQSDLQLAAYKHAVTQGWIPGLSWREENEGRENVDEVDPEEIDQDLEPEEESPAGGDIPTNIPTNGLEEEPQCEGT